jgi:hypothetical protein
MAPTPSARIQEAADLYRQFGSTTDVARKMGVGETTARRYLEKAGIERIGSSKPKEARKADLELPQFPDEDVSTAEMEKITASWVEAEKAR